MRKIITILCLFLSFTYVNAQNIASVDVNSSGYAKVYDADNKKIAEGYVGKPGDDVSYSSCIIVVRNKSGHAKVYSEKLRVKTQGYIGKTGDQFKVSGCRVIIKNKSGYKKIYNSNLRKISEGY
jgi:hypothetical protein